MDTKLLKRICNAPGIPGFEDEAQAIAVEVLSECCDDVRRDALRNVIGTRKATHPPKDRERPIRVMIDAHADECGMLAIHITGDGYIKFRTVGGLSPAVMGSQRVIIHGKKPIRGGVVPKGDGAKTEELLIDTGLSKKELEKFVQPGDPITFDEDCSRFNGKMWVARNFDDRMGTYCMLEAMRQLGDTQVDVVALSSVQEEIGCRGARAATPVIAPDIAIAIDGSMAVGAYGDASVGHCDPGKGTGIYVIDKGTISHRGLVSFLYDTCESNKIPYQRNFGGNTNAGPIQQSPGSVVACTVGAPVRYMHSTVQLCHADDMDATVDMLVKFCESAHEFAATLDH